MRCGGAHRVSREELCATVVSRSNAPGIRPTGEASTAKTRPLANTKRGGPPQVAFCVTQLKLYETSETGKKRSIKGTCQERMFSNSWQKYDTSTHSQEHEGKKDADQSQPQSLGAKLITDQRHLFLNCVGLQN